MEHLSAYCELHEDGSDFGGLISSTILIGLSSLNDTKVTRFEVENAIKNPNRTEEGNRSEDSEKSNLVGPIPFEAAKADQRSAPITCEEVNSMITGGKQMQGHLPCVAGRHDITTN